MFFLWKHQHTSDYINLSFHLSGYSWFSNMISFFLLGIGGRASQAFLASILASKPTPHFPLHRAVGMQCCRLLLNYGSESIAAECHLLRAAEQNQSVSHASSLIERLFYASKQFIVFLHAWCSFTTLINKICKTTKKLNPKSSSDASVMVNQYPACVHEGERWGYGYCDLRNPQRQTWPFPKRQFLERRYITFTL